MSAGNTGFHLLEMMTGGGYTSATACASSERYLGRPGTIATRYSGAAATCINQATSDSILVPELKTSLGTSTRHLLSASWMNGGTYASGPSPCIYTLLDIQCYWRVEMGTSASGVTQSLSGSPSLRYANGEGCNLYLVNWAETNQYDIIPYASLSVSYTNQSGVSGRQLSRSVRFFAYNPTPRVILGSGQSPAGNIHCLPLANGDYGVQNVASVKLDNISYTGYVSRTSNYVALVLARPICSFPIVGTAMCDTVDFSKSVPSLPEVKDGACLAMFSAKLDSTDGVSSSYSTVFGLTFVWG